jgi:hypothetical protein
VSDEYLIGILLSFQLILEISLRVINKGNNDTAEFTIPPFFLADITKKKVYHGLNQ